MKMKRKPERNNTARLISPNYSQNIWSCRIMRLYLDALQYTRDQLINWLAGLLNRKRMYFVVQQRGF